MKTKKTIAVVIKAYNEETQIQMVIDELPEFVDKIIVVNDCSTDNTKKVVLDMIDASPDVELLFKEKQDKKKGIYTKADKVVEEIRKSESIKFPEHEIIDNPAKRIILINLIQNSGAGAAVAVGYKWCRDNEIDCTVVIDGDGQMDPSEMESICSPILEEDIDYVKGNRLIHRSAWLVIPKIRYFGNSILSILTKIASGYWHVSDTQTGYTAISNKALNSIRLHDIYRKYGYPNDILVKLNIAFCKIREVEIKPVYNIGEQSKMKIFKVIPKISFLLIKLFFKRLWVKYLFRDFHPLFLLYNLSFVLFLAAFPFAIYIIKKVWTIGDEIAGNNLVIFVFLFISAFQSILFAMWMDIQDNERLYK